MSAMYFIETDTDSPAKILVSETCLSFSYVTVVQFSMVCGCSFVYLFQADIDCMKDHLNRPAAVGWHYLMNVAGQAYPLRTPEEMIDILRVYNGSNDIEGLSSKRRIFNRFNKVLSCDTCVQFHHCY
jgi:hypothetical protein